MVVAENTVRQEVGREWGRGIKMFGKSSVGNGFNFGQSYGSNHGANYGRKAEEELKNVRVTIQVSKREKEILTLLAKRNGQTVSEYLRSECIWKPYNRLTGGQGID